MSIHLDLYPTLGEKLLDKIGYFSENYQFFYHKDGNEVNLDSEANEFHGQTHSVILLNDSNCQWHANYYDLSFKRKCSINNPGFLFGANGIADDEAILGVAIMWSSKSSSQRGVFDSGSISKDDNKLVIDINGCFPPSQLKGTINLETIIYLKKTANNYKGIYAKKSGTILGVLDSVSIILDGNGSVFPITEVSEPGQPLWYVINKWTEPLTDSFSEENLELRINAANPAYAFMRLEDGIKESPFFKEILASAMQTIVLNVMASNYWDEVVKGEGLEDGSIGQAINYFITTFGWDTSSPERLAFSIRKDFDSRL